MSTGAILTPAETKIGGIDNPYQMAPFGEAPKPIQRFDPGSVFGAAFRTASPVGSIINDMMSQQVFQPEDGFNVFDEIKGSDYAADHAGAFVGVRSRAEMDHVKSRIDAERRDAQLLGSSGWFGTAAAIGMGLVDPTIALPGGALYRSVKGGYAVGRSAAAIGIAGGIQAGAAEAILQNTQVTRRPEEYLHSIATGTVLGGILGGGAAAVLSKAERVVLERTFALAVGDDVERAAVAAGEVATNTGTLRTADFEASAMKAGSAGAAASDLRTGEIRSAFGMEKVAREISPMRYALTSPFTSARRLALDAFETPLSMKDSVSGIAATRGGAASTLIKLDKRKADVSIQDALKVNYEAYFGSSSKIATMTNNFQSAMGKATDKLTETQFREQVSLALMSKDVHEIPEVAKAAAQLRAEVIEPLAKAAQEAKLLDLSSEVKNAQSYFPQVYNKEALKAKADEFVGWASDKLVGEQGRQRAVRDTIEMLDTQRRTIAGMAAKLEAQIARLDVADAKLSARASERGMEAGRTAARAETTADQAGTAAMRESDVAEALAALKEQLPEMRAQVEAAEKRYRDAVKAEERSAVGLADLDKVTAQEDRAAEKRVRDAIKETPETDYAFKIMLGDRKAVEMPTVAEYVAANGGVRDQIMSGEMQTLREAGVRGLVKDGGKSLDQWGEHLWQLMPEGSPRPTLSEVMDMLTAKNGDARPWWLEKGYGGDRAEKIRASQAADIWADNMVNVGLDPGKRSDVFAYFRDEKLYGEKAPAAPMGTGAVMADADIGLERARANAAKQRRAITDAMRGQDSAEKAVAGAAGKADEAARAAAFNEKRAGVLAERQSAAAEKRAAIQQALDLAEFHRSSVMKRMEQELEAWGGNSAKDALAAVKSRDGKTAAAMETGDKPPSPTAADDEVMLAAKRILNQDLDKTPDELKSLAGEIHQRLIGGPEGRMPYDWHSGGSQAGVGLTDVPMRGPLAHRKVWFDQREMAERGYLELDAEHVLRNFVNAIVPDVHFATKFSDMNLTQELKAIREEARALQVGKSAEESRKIANEADATIRRIVDMRDIERGVFNQGSVGEGLGRAAQAISAFENVTGLGGAAAASLADVAGAVFRYGLVSALSDGWAPFIRGLADAKAGVHEARAQYRAMGIGNELANAMRGNPLDDISGVYKPRSMFERVLSTAGRRMQAVNLQAPMTDHLKLVAAVVSGNEVITASKAVAEGKATARQITQLADSGIDRSMAQKIWGDWSKPGAGGVKDGVLLPNTERWSADSRRAFEAAVTREVDIAVIQPGREVPIWMSKPVIGLIGKFKSYVAGAHERILIANLQQADAFALQGAVTALSAGMLSVALVNSLSGRDMPARPQDWVKEGFARSGLLGWLDEANNIAAKATYGSVDMYRAIGADKPLSKFTNQTILGQLLGPTAGKIEGITKVLGGPFKEDGWDARSTNEARKLLPYQNLWALRLLFNQVEDSTNQMFGITPLAKRG